MCVCFCACIRGTQASVHRILKLSTLACPIKSVTLTVCNWNSWITKGCYYTCPVPRSMSYQPCPFVKFVSPYQTNTVDHEYLFCDIVSWVIVARKTSKGVWMSMMASKLTRQSLTLLNLLSQNGFTALHSACWEGHDRVAEILLQAGASLEQETKVRWGVSQDWVHVSSQAVVITAHHSVVITLLYVCITDNHHCVC